MLASSSLLQPPRLLSVPIRADGTQGGAVGQEEAADPHEARRSLVGWTSETNDVNDPNVNNLRPYDFSYAELPGQRICLPQRVDGTQRDAVVQEEIADLHESRRSVAGWTSETSLEEPAFLRQLMTHRFFYGASERCVPRIREVWSFCLYVTS
uniref:Uncharacterized protein n=1 Tax=Steinernema glaseri TaxID=37863 RepID=A0A1I7ZGA1_9BILA